MVQHRQPALTHTRTQIDSNTEHISSHSPKTLTFRTHNNCLIVRACTSRAPKNVHGNNKMSKQTDNSTNKNHHVFAFGIFISWILLAIPFVFVAFLYKLQGVLYTRFAFLALFFIHLYLIFGLFVSPNSLRFLPTANLCIRIFCRCHSFQCRCSSSICILVYVLCVYRANRSAQVNKYIERARWSEREKELFPFITPLQKAAVLRFLLCE